jgi:hypothetical protein
MSLTGLVERAAAIRPGPDGNLFGVTMGRGPK